MKGVRWLQTLVVLLAIHRALGATPLLSEEFDTPGPSGRWTVTDPALPGLILGLFSGAAHRGAAGLRLSDNHTGSGERPGATWSRSYTGGEGYVRVWLRAHPSYAGPGLDLLQLNATPSGVVAEIGLDLNPAAALRLSGFDGAGAYQVSATWPFAVDEWTLVELGVSGVGSANGRRTLVVNGVRVGEQNGIDWSGLSLGSVELGEAWAHDSTRVVIDFDDLRVAASSNAARLTLLLDSAPWVGACAPLVVELRDGAGLPSTAPYDLELALSSTAGTDTLHAGVDCSEDALGLRILAGATRAEGSFRTSSGGERTITVRHPDFLPGEGSVDAKGTAPSQSAGATEGPIDQERRALRVGCAAMPGPFSALLLLLTATCLWRTRCSDRPRSHDRSLDRRRLAGFRGTGRVRAGPSQLPAGTRSSKAESSRAPRSDWSASSASASSASSLSTSSPPRRATSSLPTSTSSPSVSASNLTTACTRSAKRSGSCPSVASTRAALEGTSMSADSPRS